MSSVEIEVRNKFLNIPGNDVVFPQEDFYPFYTYDGLRLHTYRFPAASPQALFIIFHGLHAYGNNYALVAKNLSDIGCEVVALDWRGHGKSPGIKGLLPEFSILLADCVKFATEMSALYQGLPLYLVGGSLGACMCIHVQNQIKDIRGLILFSPALKMNVSCQWLGKFILKGCTLLSPSAKLIKADTSKMTPNAELLQYFQENPFVYTDRIRAGTAQAGSIALEKVLELIDTIETPFLAIQGGGDKVVDPEMVQVFYQNAPAKDKTLWMYKGLSHALIYEEEIYKILKRVQEWVLERLHR